MEKIKKLQQNLQKSLRRRTSFYYSLARTGHFAAQGLFLPFVDLLASGKKRKTAKTYPAHLKQALIKIAELHRKESFHIENGIYPIEVLKPEKWREHLMRYPKVIVDSYFASKRRLAQETKYFTSEANDYKDEMPDYYLRNFHFQSGGYLNTKSAELYEHQVEILFSGAADAMRRLILPYLRLHFINSTDGKGLHFLELAAGTGRLTRFLALTFPKAKITCTDLSPIYLAKAKERLSDFKNINFVQASAENLPFKAEQFDAVLSCFLFHELPSEIREKVFSESFRLVKPNGIVGAVDSIQKNDDLDFEWALKQFPIDFHEPFYKNYIEDSLEAYFEKHDAKNTQSEVGFLAKVITGVKA